jgi:two-component system, chemotaxis family, sensor kinase Cph1
LDETAQQYLDYAVRGAKRMEMLVRDLLAYTQAVAVRETAARPVDASIVLEMALANLQGSMQQAGARVEKGRLPTLVVEEVHLLQLFQNLIGNAVKYRSDAPPIIQVSAERDQEMWRVCVRDNGIGINPEYARQVFGLFKRLHTAGQYEGTGIGLAICQKIVERYGGRIWVESDGEGRGSTFCFTLPGAPESVRGENGAGAAG